MINALLVTLALSTTPSPQPPPTLSVALQLASRPRDGADSDMLTDCARAGWAVATSAEDRFFATYNLAAALEQAKGFETAHPWYASAREQAEALRSEATLDTTTRAKIDQLLAYLSTVKTEPASPQPIAPLQARQMARRCLEAAVDEPQGARVDDRLFWTWHLALLGDDDGATRSSAVEGFFAEVERLSTSRRLSVELFGQMLLMIRVVEGLDTSVHE